MTLNMMPTRRHALSTLLALMTAVMLTACGFHLRGSGAQANLPFKSIFVGLPETSPLGAELRRNIRSHDGVTVTDQAKDAQVALEVLSETRDKAILSLNSQGRVRENSLTYNVRFRVVDASGKELLAPTDIGLKRTISFNESQALAKEGEEAMLYRDMQTDLVQQVLRRLAALKPV
jgi:LPS-assembly lipoprotein